MNKKVEEVVSLAKKEGRKILVIADTETTGTGETDRIVQSAYVVALFDEEKKQIFVKKYREEFILAPVPTNPAAAAVHGIWEEDLIGAKPFAESESYKELKALQKAGAIFIAHNAPFDLDMYSKEGIVWDDTLVIDTCNIARHVFGSNEDIKSKSLQYLRYFFNFDKEESFKKGLKLFGIEKLQPHTALSDVYVLLVLFKKLVQEGLVKSLLNARYLSFEPYLETTLTFGKAFEQGTPLVKAATSTYILNGKERRGIDYLNWAFLNMPFDMSRNMSISNAVAEAVVAGNLHESDKMVEPVLTYAIAFLNNATVKKLINGRDELVEKAIKSTTKNINLEIKRLTNSGKEDDKILVKKIKTDLSKLETKKKLLAEFQAKKK